MFGEFLGLTEDEMFDSQLDPDKGPVKTSLMDTPIITKEIISLINHISDAKKIKFGNKDVDNTIREEFNKEKETYLEEKGASVKRGEIAVNIGTGFVPILAEGFENKRQQIR